MPQHYARIFLLSHMRAYTSLLGHILGSHPAINGYYELHLSYVTDADLDAQLQNYTAQEPIKPGSRYLFDKLLHNDYDLNLTQLSLQGEVILCALRQPELSIKSILHLFARKNIDDLYAYPAEATTYYIDRLNRLSQFCQRYPGRYYYFDAELVCTDTAQLLTVLEQWLNLPTPLEARYQRFANTGVAGAGDTSSAIRSGTVLSQVNQYPDIVLEDALLQQAQQAYLNCRSQLLANASAAFTTTD